MLNNRHISYAKRSAIMNTLTIYQIRVISCVNIMLVCLYNTVLFKLTKSEATSQK